MCSRTRQFRLGGAAEGKFLKSADAPRGGAAEGEFLKSAVILLVVLLADSSRPESMQKGGAAEGKFLKSAPGGSRRRMKVLEVCRDFAWGGAAEGKFLKSAESRPQKDVVSAIVVVRGGRVVAEARRFL